MNNNYTNNSTNISNNYNKLYLIFFILIVIVVSVVLFFFFFVFKKKKIIETDISNLEPSKGIPIFIDIVQHYLVNFMKAHRDIPKDYLINKKIATFFVNSIVEGNNGHDDNKNIIKDEILKARFQFDGIGYKQAVLAFKEIRDGFSDRKMISRKAESIYNYIINPTIMVLCVKELDS
jgi:hypothetical protein